LRPQSVLNSIYPCQRTRAPARYTDVSANFISASGRREIFRERQKWILDFADRRARQEREGNPDAIGLADSGELDECNEDPCTNIAGSSSIEES
jgi:hypothetical protein